MVITKRNLKEARQSEGLSAAKLASLSGLSEKAVRDIENGKRPGSALTWGKIIMGLNKNSETSRTWKLSDFSEVRGEATYDSKNGNISSFQVKDRALIDQATTIIRGKVRPESSFWRSKSIDELAAEQGVHPITDFDKLSKDWPEDTDFDSFLKAVRSARD